MKRIAIACMTGMLLAGFVGFAAAQTQAQPQSDSLGDYARHVRKDKKPVSAKKYDNDNLPMSNKLSIVGNARDTSDQATSDNQSAQPAPAEQQKAETPAKSNDDWKADIDSEKKKFDDAARELDLLQREYRLRAAVMYADAGNRMRNQSSWDKEDADYKDKIAQKQKEVNDEKQKLDDLQEKARKAGVPNSSRE